MKKIILSLAIAFSFTYGIAQVSNTTLPEEAAKQYYDQGNAALASNKLIEASQIFETLKEIENGVFEVKNKTTKSKEYYYTEEEAKKVVASGNYSEPKAKALTTKYYEDAEKKLRDLSNKKHQEAISAYNAKDMAGAAAKFEELGHLYNAMGYTEGNDNLFDAGKLYQTAKKYPEAMRIYNDLFQKNYTGVSTKYYMTEVATDKKIQVEKADWEAYKNNPILSKTYKDYTTENTPDVSKELYTYASAIANELKDYNKAIEIAEFGLKKFPADSDLSNTRFAAYKETGKLAKLEEVTRANLIANPNDLGASIDLASILISSDKPGIKNINEAKTILTTAYKNNPENIAVIRSLINVYAIEDNTFRDGLVAIKGNTQADTAKFKALENNRKSLHAQMLPLLKKAQASDPTDLGVLRNIKVSYSILGMEKEKAEIEAKIKELSGS